MVPVIPNVKLIDQPWLNDFLEAHSFQRTADGHFSNGRATIRLEDELLFAIPSDGAKTWRSDLKDARPEMVRSILTTILSTTPFLSQAELDHRATQQRAAEKALQSIAASIRDHPDTHSGQHLRRFVWTIWNGHHALNLWRMKDVLDAQHNEWVTDVFTAWMLGFVSDTAIRTALFDSGEMDRWDTVRLRAPDRRRLVDAIDAVTDMINSTPPGAASRELTRANGLLRQVLDCLRQSNPECG